MRNMGHSFFVERDGRNGVSATRQSLAAESNLGLKSKAQWVAQ